MSDELEIISEEILCSGLWMRVPLRDAVSARAVGSFPCGINAKCGRHTHHMNHDGGDGDSLRNTGYYLRTNGRSRRLRYLQSLLHETLLQKHSVH
jgi:hypothetical protein